MTDADPRKAQIRVARALQNARMGTELAVRASDGISGGSMIGETIEAYVVAEPPHGYQVEMWTHTGNDAYHIAVFTTLADAIQCAIDAAGDTAPRRGTPSVPQAAVRRGSSLPLSSSTRA